LPAFSPVIDPRFSYRAENVVETREEVCARVGYTKTIRVDQGSEFVSRDPDLWACTNDVTVDFSRPGKPTDRAVVRHWFKDNGEGLHRGVQRTVPGGVYERQPVPDPCRRLRKDGGLAQILQRGSTPRRDRIKVQEFDYIIVGAGSAGSPVARALSDNPGVSVLSIEAGPHGDRFWVTTPAGMAKLYFHPLLNWNYHTEPMARLRDRRMCWPRGKLLGGSSAINGMIFVRGHPADFDSWRDSGAAGWGYTDVLPHFRAMGLCCTNPVRDSSRESSVIAGGHEQTEHPELQETELARVQ
jgi:hypothetical protein